MSTRGGNNTKKAQKHQNSFSFKHNKNSLLTRKIAQSPLDNLCKRCLEKLEWRISFRKYKPLSNPGKCLKCEGKTIYKAYRTICDACALTNKVCSKCGEACEEYAKPTNWKNDPSKKNKHLQKDPMSEILKNLKVRCKRTVERKLREGEDLVFDEQKGILNEETGEIVVDIKYIYGEDYTVDNDEEENIDESWNEDDNDSSDGEEKKIQPVSTNIDKSESQSEAQSEYKIQI